MLLTLIGTKATIGRSFGGSIDNSNVLRRRLPLCQWYSAVLGIPGWQNSLQFLVLHVKFFRLAAGRPTQAGGDTTDQWRDRWNAATVCPTQWRLLASAGWLSWMVDVDRPSVEGHPKQCNRLDPSPGCLGPHVRLDERDVLTPQVRRCVPGSVWRAVLLQTSVQDASATPAVCDSYVVLKTITETINTLFLVVNLLTCVMCCYRSRLVFSCCF